MLPKSNGLKLKNKKSPFQNSIKGREMDFSLLFEGDVLAD